MGYEHKALIQEELLERPDHVDKLFVLKEKHVSRFQLGNSNDVVERSPLLLFKRQEYGMVPNIGIIPSQND